MKQGGVGHTGEKYSNKEIDFFPYNKKLHPSNKFLDSIVFETLKRFDQIIDLRHDIFSQKREPLWNPKIYDSPQKNDIETIIFDKRYENDKNNDIEIPLDTKLQLPRKSTTKFHDPNITHSVTSANLKRFVDVVWAVLSDLWTKEFKAMFGTSFIVPEVVFHDSLVAKIRTIAGEEQSVFSPIFYYPTFDTVHLSRDILDLIDLKTTPESAIGLTLIIAHEFGHALKNQLFLDIETGDEEDLSDFLAGYTLKLLGGMGILGEEDEALAKSLFRYMGTPLEKRGKEKVHDTPEGRVSHLMRGYSSTREDVAREIRTFRPKIFSDKIFLEYLSRISEKTKLKKQIH